MKLIFNTFLSSADFILNNNASLGYRQSNTAYNVGQITYHSSLPTGWFLECTTAGKSSSGDLTIMSGFGSTVTDGTVTWTIGKSLSVNGGYMMGNILYDNRASSNTFVISGDVTPSKGAALELLRESDNQTISSQWMLGSHWSESGTSKRCYLLGRKDNSLRWVRSDETQTDLAGAAIVAKSITIHGYIKYASELIIQWGYINQPGWTSNIHNITLPISHNNFTYYMNVITDCNTSSESYYTEPCNYTWISYVENVPGYNYYSQERVYCSRPWNQAAHRYILICK